LGLSFRAAAAVHGIFLTGRGARRRHVEYDGHEADIEDATTAPAASPNALDAPAALFFPPAPGTSSSFVRPSPYAEQVSPAGGKLPECAHRPHGSGSFKMAPSSS
jgi:hypothetical protein